MLDYINDKQKRFEVKEGDSVYIFGAGMYGLILAYFLKKNNVQVLNFFDNDSSKNEKIVFDGIKCYNPYKSDISKVCIVAAKSDEARKLLMKQAYTIGYYKVCDINTDLIYEMYNQLEDINFLQIQFAQRCGYCLDLKNPKTYNEKIQWLKLYDRNPLFTKLADKYEVKKYVMDKIGKEHIIPTYGVWDKWEDIDFENLPNQFVLKCTHDSGSTILCKDKQKLDFINKDKQEFDFTSAREYINKSLKYDHYKTCREWVYKDIPHRIIAEQYMENSVSSNLMDYRFLCFNGHAKMIELDFDRFINLKRNLYTRDWKFINETMNLPNDENRIFEKPKKLNEMIKIAETLSEGIRHVRVDLYLVDDNIYFGELTFYNVAGYIKFSSEEMAIKMGNFIDIQ